MCKTQLLFHFVLLALLLTATQSGFATTPPPTPLSFSNNFFVTGDYIVAGAVGINQTVVNNLTTGPISVPDANPGITGATSVPKGAQIVAALLYWETVESNNNPGSGQSGFFLPVAISKAFGAAGPPNGGLGYKIQGVNVSPNGNVAWSNGGCPSTSTGRVVSVYRADVRTLLPVDGNGNVLEGSSGAPQQYKVTLPSTSTGSPPISLGATLVIIYRVLSQDVPLNSIVIYEGAFGQSTINLPSSLIMLQTVKGFYDAAASPVNRLTHIVGSGQSNKFQTVYFSSGSDPNNLIALPSLYGSGQAAFPGYYGDWDNPTWTFGDPNYPSPVNPVGPPYPNPVQEDAASATTKVVPSTSQQGCVDWGAVIVETRVKNRDNDGILDSWKTTVPPGYCDAALNNGVCLVGNTSDPGWVALPGAQLGTDGNPHPDIFVQLDYVCQNKQSGTNACGSGYSFKPTDDVVTAVTNAFADNYPDKARHQPVNLHVLPQWAIQEQTCSDATNNNVLCTFPDQPGAPQPGVIGWKWGYALVKNQFVDPNGDTSACTTSPLPANCKLRFQHGRKDSFHYALFGHALGNPKWGFLSGLTNSTGTAPPPAGVVSQSGNMVTFYTTTGHGLVVSSASAQQCLSGTIIGCPANGRVTISDATSNPNLNGTWLVTSTICPTNPITLVSNDCSVSNQALGPYEFQVQVGTSVTTSYTQQTDPNLAVTPGKAGTGSGISDIGGADTLVTLGNWPSADVTSKVISGIFTHELGHGLGLTHGGLYYNNLSSTPSTNLSLNDYTPTYEANCKPNFLSVMSYSFAVDLLDNQFLDYAEESLPSPTTALDEFNGPSTPFTSSYYSDTAWYAPTTKGDPQAASRHCDGSPILTSDVQPYMFRMFGPTTSFSWTTPQDINFDGNNNGIFSGHSDWSPTSTSPGLDLRQISAIGNLSEEGPGTLNGGPGTLNGGPGTLNGGPGTLNGGPGTLNGGPGTLNGGPGTLNGGPGTLNGGPSDLAHESLKSYARPPLNPVASEDVSARIIHVTWPRPFGSPIQYTVYRSVAGGPFSQASTVSGTPLAPTYTFNDTVTCNSGGYTYYVTSTVTDDLTNQQIVSQPSNPTSNSPLLTGCYTNTPGTVSLNAVSFSTTAVKRGTQVPITWSLQDDDTGAYVNRLQANTLVAIGPTNYTNVCAPFTASTPRTTLLSQGTVTNASRSTFAVSSSTPYLFNFTWNTTGFSSGCYYFTLTLDSAQTKTSTSAVPLK
jgi:hypothetical protein